jgi:hypothetical protein
MEQWDLIKKAYVAFFKIPAIIVDCMAVEPVMVLLGKGYSNKRIARELEEDEENVRLTVKEVTGFCGYAEDLDYDPSAVFKRNYYNRYRFTAEVKRISPASSEESIKQAYKICEILDRLEGKLEKYVK